ncbi:hypothetical protein ACTQ4A_05090 [Bifidobacterium pseudolongum]|uniref:hypothetical protein n=1 Tax=Bifidobacterium pseudolongum TaxID=1694 RepID=UPI003F8FB3DA
MAHPLLLGGARCTGFPLYSVVRAPPVPHGVGLVVGFGATPGRIIEAMRTLETLV